MEQGLFITVEGTDGSGKTTQIRLMHDYIREKGFDVVLTREPGGTQISEKIRALILNPEHREMGIVTEMLLYASARAQLVHEVIKPAIESNKVVICDRFVDSSYVYQGFGRGIDLNIIADINRAALDGLMPDITFFFDLDPEIALSRQAARSEADRIEREDIEFHRKVYSGYKNLALFQPDRIKTIDSNRRIAEVFSDVKQWLDSLLD